jgi:hypothetical protein
MKIEGCLFFVFSCKWNRGIFEDQPVFKQLKVRFSMIRLEWERKQVVKEIVSKIGDQHDNIR